MLAKTRISAPVVLLFAAVPLLAGPPGPQGGGVTLLPNGWRIAPAGRHITVGDLPLAMVESADSAVIRALVLADRTLKNRGGGLALAYPQPGVARALSLLGVDQAIEVRDGMSAGADPER